MRCHVYSADFQRPEGTTDYPYKLHHESRTTSGDEVMVSYTYRVLIQRHGHLLFLDLPRPTKGLHVQLDYGQVDIRQVNVVDYFASPDASRIERSPAAAPARTIDVGFDGWVFPRAGVAFVWVLTDEGNRHRGHEQGSNDK